MMNRKSKIYTGQGDGGNTRLYGGRLVPKDNPFIEVYGTIDELNSILGVIVSIRPANKIQNILKQLQQDLFLISAELAAPVKQPKKGFRQRFKEQNIHQLERLIDAWDADLPVLKNFILPGGTSIAAWLHLARTVCRRAERRLVTLMRRDDTNPHIQIYLNRLSDLFFVLARSINRQKGKQDVIWKNIA